MVLVPAARASRESPGRGVVRVFVNVFGDRPLLLIFGLRLFEELLRWWASRRQFNIMRLQVFRQTDDVDVEVIQGCLLSLDHLVNMGRVEKRTLFTKSLLELLGGNRYLVHELLQATQTARQQSRNCLVVRFLPEDAKYHVLQACLNEVSALFGQNFVHFNALDGDTSGVFKSTWYGLTVMTPTRPPSRSTSQKRGSDLAEGDAKETMTFTDMSRMPRATLRIALVNESELRRISDGKLRPPSWGFFNERHEERFRMINDFAKNFGKQLVRTSADARSINERNPFTSEKVHSKTAPEAKQDGGHMKRVQSVPNMGMAMAMSKSRSGSKDLVTQSSESDLGANRERRASRDEKWDQKEGKETDVGVISENNCFLRLHVPHFLGHKESSLTRTASELIKEQAALTLGPRTPDPASPPHSLQSRRRSLTTGGSNSNLLSQ